MRWRGIHTSRSCQTPDPALRTLYPVLMLHNMLWIDRKSLSGRQEFLLQEHLQCFAHGRDGVVDVSRDMSRRGHPGQARQIDAVEEHRPPKGVNQPDILRTVQLAKIAPVRDEIVTGWSRPAVPGQQLESREIAIGYPIDVAFREHDIKALPENAGVFIGLPDRALRWQPTGASSSPPRQIVDWR